jgi:multiple sugar transport system substrate-binding protein
MEACTREWSRLHPEVAISWEARSLTGFGDQPLGEVADQYDLLAIDHPFCGSAEAAGILRPLDELLTPEQLAELRADSIGPSYDSYTFTGHQWAIPTDAACHVSAARPDLLDGGPLPTTWDEALALARRVTPRVATPLAPAHAISCFLTLCANAGLPAASDPSQLVPKDVGLRALDILSELHALGPRPATQWEPPDVLGLLTTTDAIVYVPLTYSYITYVSPTAVPYPCRFGAIPSAGAGPVGAILGGAGLAVSATSAHPEQAAAFARWAASVGAQGTFVFASGGQPSSRSAWTDLELDRKARGFFSDTAATLESAWVRPRDAWWPQFQLEGGRVLAAGIEDGNDAHTVLRRLESVYRSRAGS